MATTTHVVPDAQMPQGHDWVRLDADNGDIVILFRASTMAALPTPDGEPYGEADPLTCQQVTIPDPCRTVLDKGSSTLRLVV